MPSMVKPLPTRSAIHPNSSMPMVTAAMFALLKAVRTRARSATGVHPSTSEMMTGLKAAALHPMRTMRVAAASFTLMKLSAAMEMPPRTRAASAIRNIFERPRPAPARSTPTPPTSQPERRPEKAEPDQSRHHVGLHESGKHKTKALAPRFCTPATSVRTRIPVCSRTRNATPARKSLASSPSRSKTPRGCRSRGGG